MFTEQARYSLLHQNDRGTWSLDKKTVLLVGCLVLPVTLFCGTYMILFGIYEKLIYPKSLVSGELSSVSLHRAVTYNSYINFVNITEIPSHNTFVSKARPKFNLICYYNFPHDKNSMQVDDLDPHLCTHINIAFAIVVNNSIYLDEVHKETLKSIVQLKKKNSDLKILLSIGGSNGGGGFAEMVFNHSNRKTFIKSAINYVKNYQIDGIDVDWEFPGQDPDFDLYQKRHFTQLILEMRKTVLKQPKYGFLISVAVAAPSQLVEFGYDVSYLNEYVDIVNIMSYDYHFFTKLTPFTGINSPLYPSSNEKYYLATLNINYSTHYWNYLGMDKNKINVGLPTYGHTFRLINPRNKDLYAPAMGYGKLGVNGFADYLQICNFLLANHISPVFDMDSKSPYASKYYEWVSFDDEQSLTYKAEFVKNNNFGGVMIYCLNADDYKGACKMGGRAGVKFPLINAIKSVLDSDNIDA